MKKRLRFSKNICQINFPFMLHNLTPWQEQVKKETKKLQGYYRVGKNTEWGFTINQYGASITLSKLK